MAADFLPAPQRNTVDTKSQVCAIVWSRHEEELVSSHGFSHNQLTLWKYPSMVKMAELTGHTSRVLHLAQSPDGETVRVRMPASFAEATDTPTHCCCLALAIDRHG
eukprot:SAG22_NODE_2350_length_2678_cov_4.230322_4_plen_106_part_00